MRLSPSEFYAPSSKATNGNFHLDHCKYKDQSKISLNIPYPSCNTSKKQKQKTKNRKTEKWRSTIQTQTHYKIIKYLNYHTTSMSCSLDMFVSKSIITLVSKIYYWQMDDFLKSFVVHVCGYQDVRFYRCQVAFENNPQIQD